jgi:hypothetical protein
MRREVRDEMLGGALRDLHVPEHGAAFGATVRARLLEEPARGDLTSLPSRRPASQARRSQGRRPRAWRSWGRRLASAAVVAAAALAVTSALPGTTPRKATAAEVRQAVAHVWASIENVRGILVWIAPEIYEGERRWSFLLTDRGDLRLEDLGRGGTVAYDAGEGVERSLTPSESLPGDDLFASERRGLAPGPPDEGPSEHLLDRSLGSVVRALAAGEGGTVTEVTYEGRPAWRLDTDVRANLVAPSPDHLVVTVDRETGLPLRAVATRGGEPVWEVRIEDPRVNVPVGDDAFGLEFPPGAEVFRTDAGFRPVSQGEAERIVGYEPLAPAWVPDGYALARTLASEKPQRTGSEAGNPAVGDVVSTSYRRGLDRVIVTTRPVGEDPSLWRDPLATGEGYRDEPERVTLPAGALAGETAEVLIDPLAIPHLWVQTDDLVITVSGDLTRAELLRVAGSLA